MFTNFTKLNFFNFNATITIKTEFIAYITIRSFAYTLLPLLFNFLIDKFIGFLL